MNVTPTRSGPATGSRCGLALTLLKWMLAAWVGASLLFAHGCHGNEDHELFAAVVRWF